jgi:hypothetical protein
MGIISQMRQDMEALQFGNPTLQSPSHYPPATGTPANHHAMLELYKHIERLQKLLLKASLARGPGADSVPASPTRAGWASGMSHVEDSSSSAGVMTTTLKRLEHAQQEVRSLTRERTRLLDLNNGLACEVRELRATAAAGSPAVKVVRHVEVQCDGPEASSREGGQAVAPARRSTQPRPSILPVLAGVYGFNHRLLVRSNKPVPGTTSSRPRDKPLGIRNWNVQDDA